MALKSTSADGKTRSSVQIFIVFSLCCFFYILGAWQRSGFGKGDSIALQMTNSGADCDIVPSLNFETHHAGESSIVGSSTKVKAFEPCDARYTDYTPCQDQRRAMTFPRDSMIYRERHCVPESEKLRCLVPAPKGYVTPFSWPKSRDYVPYANAPYKALTVEKAIQNWIQCEGDVFRFPGGGTQFPQGADKYIDQLASVIPMENGTVRTALDTGCGVASWGAYLWSRNVRAMSFAPRDSHEAQVQFALERGVPAVIGVLGTIKLPYPTRAFDMAHCSRCLIPWGANDGMYLMEVDRVLRPGGYWILSGPPINWKINYKAWQRPKDELQEEQRKIEEAAKLLCWEKKYEHGEIAIWQKRVNDEACRSRRDDPRANFCKTDDTDDVWYKKMEACITPYPETSSSDEVAGGELQVFPDRLNAVPPRISSGSISGVTVDAYEDDNRQWKKHVKAYVAYVEPSIRPDDSRYGENPNRLQRHTQFQVILKPDPGNSQDLFINSLSALGIDVTQHDIRFVEDNWESPVLGAWGLGWEIWMDGMEITQFTYFQQAGSLQLSPVSVEITYGLERILMLLQEVDHFKKILYADGITYGELFLENEKEMSSYYLEHASVDRLQKHFDSFDEEARSLLALGLPIPAYDQLLKTSHAFNILDARGFVGVTERARYFGRMRSLARQCAQLWLKTRESLGHPLGVASEHIPPIHHGAALENVAEKVPEDPRSFIIEIGTEEMPPPDVINASEQLRVLVVQLLENQRLRHGVVKAFGTPRRLVVLVVAMSPKQLEEEVEVRGPPASKAFDDQGNPTKAADGFSRRYGVPLEKLYRKVDGKTEYVHARVTQLARLALEVLSEELPGILAKISFPKSMRWNSSVMFSRPVRWVMALHGDLVVPFCFAGNTSGNVSFGLRNTASATLLVDTAESYEDTMRNAGINIEIEERKKIILDKSNALAKSVNGRVVVQQNLLNEVANLVEAPVPLIGKFKESFLELPDELLTIVMQKHQKYFSLTDESGKLLPYFIAVANGAINEDVVRKGNEAVLRARYEDAKFFYGVDTRKKFSEFRDQLKGILFHEKLGTMLDKMNRLEKMVTKLCLALEIDEDLLPVVGEAASLALSDLATAVVTEFTALSGIMARHYALRDGYSEQIAEALLEITLPRFSGDVIPKTDAGMVLAIGDRLDSLVGLFAAGCQPSSTNDPFGLRRISYGLVQILVEKDKNVNFKHALEIAASVQPVKVEANTLDDVYQFVTRRLEQLLVDSGVSPEVVRSVLAERGNDPCLAARTAYEMEKLSKGEIFPKIVEAYSRPTRIVRGKDVDVGVEVDEAVFETSQEKELWSIYTSIKDRIHSGIGIEEFTEISTQLVEPLEDFFNNVFVMVEEEKVRKNRLALLNNIASLPSGIADLSFLPGF